MRTRHGTSLVELIVALTLLGVGALALAGTGALALRLSAEARRQASAARLAHSRIERLRSACAPAAAGAATSPEGIEERWSVAADGPLRVIVDSLVVPAHRGADTLVVLGSAWCP